MKIAVIWSCEIALKEPVTFKVAFFLNLNSSLAEYGLFLKFVTGESGLVLAPEQDVVENSWAKQTGVIKGEHFVRIKFKI